MAVEQIGHYSQPSNTYSGPRIWLVSLVLSFFKLWEITSWQLFTITYLVLTVGCFEEWLASRCGHCHCQRWYWWFLMWNTGAAVTKVFHALLQMWLWLMKIPIQGNVAMHVTQPGGQNWNESIVAQCKLGKQYLWKKIDLPWVSRTFSNPERYLKVPVSLKIHNFIWFQIMRTHRMSSLLYIDLK